MNDITVLKPVNEKWNKLGQERVTHFGSYKNFKNQ